MSVPTARDGGGAPSPGAPSDVFWRLADVLPEGVLCLRDGCVQAANATLCGLSGRGEGVLGLKLQDLFADRGQGLPKGGADRVECVLLRPGGERLPVRCRRIELSTADAEAHGLDVWLIEDLGRLRALEEELHRTGAELARANREAEELRERLRGERSEREELLSIVSHELRTPLTVIGGYNRLLLEGEAGPINDDQRRFLLEARKSCERLNRFIGNLIEASRAEKGAHALELTRGPLRPVLDGVAGMFQPMLEERGMTLSVACEGSARYDPLRLEQVLANLVGNAVKYGERGGHIWVSAAPVTPTSGARPMVRIAVSDDGPGVSASDRERIFEPYVQGGDEARPGALGLGLGLAICRRLVEAHGGEIHCEPREGGGARFVFTLPAASDAEISGGAPS